MKTSSILTALLLLFSVCVSAQKYPVTPRAMVNGKIIIGDQQYVNAGDSVMVTCEPDPKIKAVSLKTVPANNTTGSRCPLPLLRCGHPSSPCVHW